jgi:hypothetical protein
VQTHKIECDECGADLTYTGNCEDYYLVLGNASKGHRPGTYAVTSMAISPPLKQEHHFCGLKCMDQWRDRQRHKNGLWEQWWSKWKDEHGTKDGTERVRSYPSPTDDITGPVEAEFTAASLTAFPKRQSRK